jgi:hypothetical protein
MARTVVSEEPAPKPGYRCICCSQRIKWFRVRYPVKGRPVGTSEALRLIGFRHPGCSLKAA